MRRSFHAGATAARQTAAMQNITQPLAPQFDQILGEIAAGRSERGILQLSGMLDAMVAEGLDQAAIRAGLLAHPLGQALNDPQAAQAAASLGFVEAGQTRAALARDTLEQAWQRGERCLVFSDCGGAELERLAGRDLSNLALAPAHRTNPALFPALAGSEPFDLILAAGLADRLSAAELAQFVSTAAYRLAPQGRLVMSTFVPGHLGSGWQAICFGRTVECHAEAALTEAAARADLSARLFRDASGCLIWAELNRTEISTKKGGRP